MADASRFPDLSLPFAVVGGCAATLWTGLLASATFRVSIDALPVALLAAALAGIAGRVVKRLCVGRRYAYELDDDVAARRSASNRWFAHALVVVATGAFVGALHAYLSNLGWYLGFTLSGAICGALFVPVCLSVVSAARRAQRARLGSLVAASDRRAVWSTLATALMASTVLALPRWADRHPAPPTDAVVVLFGAYAVVVAALCADLHACHRLTEIARKELCAGRGLDASDVAAPFDLGLGEEVHAEVAPAASPYRHRDRAVALVLGSPDEARRALDRAVRRGWIGIGVAGAVAALDVAARVSVVTRALVDQAIAAAVAR